MRSFWDRIAAFYLRHETAFAVGTLLVLGALAYLPLIQDRGFYRDDWYMLWAGRAFGPQAIIDLFAYDRPFVGYIYSLSYQLLGEHPLRWQIYTLIVRTIGALGFLWMLRRLWPDRKIETTAAAILLFIYPGFLQWANANTKSNHLTTYTIAILSICLTVAAYQARKTGWKVLFSIGALAMAVGYWFLYEYMIGLEGLRLMIIGLLVWREKPGTWKTNLIRAVKIWVPYFVLIVLHLAWRMFFFTSGRDALNIDSAFSVYLSSPLRLITKRAFELGKDVFETVISAWAVPINSITFHLETMDFLIAGILSALAIGIFAAYFFAIYNRELDPVATPGGDAKRSALEIILLGGTAVIFTLAPVIAVGRDVRWTSGFDKYTLQASAGTALLLVGLISLLARSKLQFIPYALLIGIAIATQYGTAVWWADFWEDQRELWWQLSWRAPQLEENTVLLVEMPDEGFFEDYEIWGPANFVYNPDGDSLRVVSEILTADTLEKIRVGQSEIGGLRDLIEYPRSYLDSLILTRPERISCWHALDGSDPLFPQTTSTMIYTTVRLSDTDLIQVDAPQSVPPTHIFGPEPDHRWCYYFQKASLETQRGNWEATADLTDQALDSGLKAIDRSEWLPFLKGLVMVGRDEDARQVALWLRDNEVVRHRQCDYLNDNSLPNPERQAFLEQVLCE